MLNDRNSAQNSGYRNLSDVFKELQEMQHQPNNNQQNDFKHSSDNFQNLNNTYANNDYTFTTYDTSTQSKQKKDKVKNLNFFNKNTTNTNETNSYYTYSKSSKIKELKLYHIITSCAILIVSTAVFFPKSAAFKESYAKEETINTVSNYEINRHRINIQSILSENADLNRVKEQVTEERDVEYETTYTNNSSLPKDEEVVKQEGSLGKDNVTVVKTYENDEFVEEIILAKERLQEPVEKIIDRGTSEFLAKNKVHIGDTLYATNTVKLKKTADSSSEDVAEIKKSLDVKLLELPNEEWCKVSFDTIQGYIPTSDLTSAAITPSIVEKNRIQRILLKVNINMELNKSSGLTLNDYKTIFTNLSNDTNKVFENNYTVFYNMEKKYNINGIFLASMAIHESGWGSSQIANDKNNLFGYGSYDSTPYDSSYTFTDYSEGIETVAKSLVKYYLNPAGTIIYDGETASAWYYNGPTLEGVNTRYASDSNWHTKVYTYMEMLYNRLNS